jgi:hypothetical protein
MLGRLVDEGTSWSASTPSVDGRSSDDVRFDVPTLQHGDDARRRRALVMQMQRRNVGASNASLVGPKQWDADDNVDVPTTFGLTKARKPSLQELFFGDLDRVPHAGVFKLSSDRRYRSTVKAGNQV